MDYKLVAIDLDNTLLNSESVVSDANLAALRSIIDRGTHVAIATGRRFSPTTLKIASAIDRPVYLVLYNGAVVMDLDHTELYRLNLARPDVEWLVGLICKRYGVHWRVGCDEIDLLWRRGDGGPTVGDMQGEVWKPITSPLEPLSYCPSGVLKVRVWASDQEVSDIRSSINGRKLYTESYSYPGTGDAYIEFQDPGVSKKVGIEVLTKKLGIELGNVVAFGDQLNDVDMLSGVGLGIAMGNAIEEAKQAAKVITATNDEDGVAVALAQLFPESLSH